MRNFGHKRLKGGCVGLCQGADEVWSVFVPTGMLAGGIRLPKHEDPAGGLLCKRFHASSGSFFAADLFLLLFSADFAEAFQNRFCLPFKTSAWKKSVCCAWRILALKR